ncbi:hypothetical protein KAU25_04790 [Candidatus Bathyarchaeota archaeon]|nr:hypothetical protein [Candidatus Bathyarchaeota archaeon]
MFIETLKGTHYEIGYQIGEKMVEQGRGLPEYVKDVKERNVQFAQETERKVRPVISGLLEEVDGIADGSGYPRNIILTLVLTLGRIPGCTALAVNCKQKEGGRIIFGRNYDGPSGCKDFTLYKTYPDGDLSHVGCCWDLLVGREDGINEAGLAIAVNGVHGVYNDKPGVWDHIPVRAVLDNCETTSSAVSLLRKIPHLFSKNFLVADATGEIAVVEAAQQNVTVQHCKNGFGAITNHFTSKTMRQYNNPKLRMLKTEERLKTAEAWLQQRSELIDLTGLKKLLTDVRDGVCSNGKNFSTAWSWVAQCGERSIELATETPVKADFNRYEF